MKIDVYDIYTKIDDIRVDLKDEFIIKLRKEILNNYSSFMDFARKENLKVVEHQDYTPLKTWLRENSEYRAVFPLKSLIKICESLKINKEEIYKNILSFKIWNSKGYKPKRFIEIDSDFIYGLGIYLAEGKNNDCRKYRTGLTNNETRILKFFIFWMRKYFKIELDKLNFYISIPPHRMFEKDIIRNDVSKQFSCSTNKIKGYNRKGQRTSNITIEISHDSKPLRLLVEWLKTNLNEVIYNSTEFSKLFLQGVFDGEAHIRKNHPEIIMEMLGSNILDFCEILLRKNNIKPNRGKDCLIIQARDFNKIELFRLQNKRRLTFRMHRKNIKGIQVSKGFAVTNMLSFLKADEFLDAKTIAENSNYKDSGSVLRICKQAQRAGYANIIGTGMKYDAYRFSLSDAGSEYLKLSQNKEIDRIRQLKQNINMV